MDKKNNISPVLWVGTEIEQTSEIPKDLQKKNVSFYNKCIFSALTLKVGDFVLISNADATDPDSIEGCDIAKINFLYENESPSSSSSPYRAIVQWYSRPQNIPERLYDSDDISIDFDREVIEDWRPFDRDVDIETVYKKCNVIMGDTKDSAAKLIQKHSKKKDIAFVCRYKLFKTWNFVKYRLFPLYEEVTNTKPKTPNSSKKKGSEKNRNARRNLNTTYDSDGNSSSNSDILNYSVIETPKTRKENEVKLILRVSSKQKRKSISTDSSMKENLIDYVDFNIKSSYDNTDPLDPLTPSKKVKSQNIEEIPVAKLISKERRKSILKTPGETNSAPGTPKRNIKLSNIVEERLYDKNSAPHTPSKHTKSPKLKSSSKSKMLTPQKQLKTIRCGDLTPTLSNREKSSKHRKSDLQLARENLHVSTIPECLPCRETEFENIYSFIEHKVTYESGGCMYISGVPGTGKTATVTGVIRSLKQKAQSDEIPDFEFVEINGMRLTEPRQAYVQIYKQLTGKSLSWEHAHSLLEKRFTTPAPRRVTTVLLVDELDILCNRRQDVVYNLLDWPSKSSAKLVVITIANTMDLPERLLMGKVTSRLGLTRLTFQPYTHKQLQQIVTSRLIDSDAFKSDAVQLVARKVAAVSGDARRALDICRRATEITEQEVKNKKDKVLVNMIHVQKALEEMISGAKVQAIKNCSKLEKIFLQAISAEIARTGVEETMFHGVYSQFESITAFMGLSTPCPGMTLKICARLGEQRLLISEHSRQDIFQKILLNVSTDDIHFALQANFD